MVLSLTPGGISGGTSHCEGKARSPRPRAYTYRDNAQLGQRLQASFDRDSLISLNRPNDRLS